MADSFTKEVGGLLGDKLENCESPSLRLEKFVHIGDNSKKDEIDAVVACHRAHAKTIPTFEPKGTVAFVAKLGSRLIINQAGGILENAGICLHPHFGAPFIPGSAVKGIARHAAWCEWYEEADEAKKSEIANRIAEVFGYPTGDPDGLDAYLAKRGWEDMAKAGTISFLPATPIDAGRLATDIVNCHHPDYYAGKEPAATDDESPNPQFFPTVDEGVSFVFRIVPLRTGADVSAAKDWLVRAITGNGAGAKTAAGYGWFDVDTRFTEEWKKRIDDELRRQKIRKKQEDWSRRRDALQALPDEELAARRADVMSLKKDLDSFQLEFKNQQLGSVNLLVKRLPVESPIDALRSRWETMTDKARLAEIKGFPRERNEERKKSIVLLLREASGVGHDLWQLVRSGQQGGDVAKGTQAIREYAKTTLQLGKMP